VIQLYLLVGARGILPQGPIHEEEGDAGIAQDIGQSICKRHGFQDAVAVLLELGQSKAREGGKKGGRESTKQGCL